MEIEGMSLFCTAIYRLEGISAAFHEEESDRLDEDPVCYAPTYPWSTLHDFLKLRLNDELAATSLARWILRYGKRHDQPAPHVIDGNHDMISLGTNPHVTGHKHNVVTNVTQLLS
jgi:hypothetical protein